MELEKPELRLSKIVVADELEDNSIIRFDPLLGLAILFVPKKMVNNKRFLDCEIKRAVKTLEDKNYIKQGGPHYGKT